MKTNNNCMYLIGVHKRVPIRAIGGQYIFQLKEQTFDVPANIERHFIFWAHASQQSFLILSWLRTHLNSGLTLDEFNVFFQHFVHTHPVTVIEPLSWQEAPFYDSEYGEVVLYNANEHMVLKKSEVAMLWRFITSDTNDKAAAFSRVMSWFCNASPEKGLRYAAAFLEQYGVGGGSDIRDLERTYRYDACMMETKSFARRDLAAQFKFLLIMTIGAMVLGLIMYGAIMITTHSTSYFAWMFAGLIIAGVLGFVGKIFGVDKH